MFKGLKHLSKAYTLLYKGFGHMFTGLKWKIPRGERKKTITNKKQIKDYGKLHFTGTPSGNV